jgi:hypothetical protein
MTIPPEPPPPPPPPDTVGTQPRNAAEVNGLVGLHLRQFLAAKVLVNQDHDWMAGVDLKETPYYFTADQETLIKSAIGALDASLDAVDLTFISQVVGMG